MNLMQEALIIGLFLVQRIRRESRCLYTGGVLRGRHRRVAWWDEPDTRPFLLSIYALGHQSAVMAHRDEAVNCVRQLLKMDPSDRLGAEEMARTVDLLPVAAADLAAGLRM